MRWRSLCIVLALLAVACGGDGGVLGTSTSQPPDTSTSTEPTAPNGSTSSTMPSRLDFAVPDLQSYRYDVSLDGETDTGAEVVTFRTDISGLFAAPDSHFVDRQELLNGNLDRSAIAVIIGDDAWVDAGDGFTMYNRNASIVQSVGDDFTSLSELLPDAEFYDQLRVTDVTYTTEEENGATVHHLLLDRDTPSLDALLGGGGDIDIARLAEFTFDIWLDAASGRVIRFEAVFAGPSSAFDPELMGTTRISVSATVADYDDPSIQVSPPRPDGSLPPPGYQTFIDNEVGFFSVFYPSAWEVPPGVPGPVEDGVSVAFEAISPPDGDDAFENMNVTVEFVDFPDLTLDQYLDLSLTTLEEFSGFQLVSIEAITTAEGFDARWVEFTADDGTGGALYFIQTFILGDNVGYVATYTALPETVGSYLAEYRALVDSFSLLDV